MHGKTTVGSDVTNLNVTNSLALSPGSVDSVSVALNAGPYIPATELSKREHQKCTLRRERALYLYICLWEKGSDVIDNAT